MANSTEKNKENQKPVCFVIMPFSDPEGYEPGHFKKVYEQIFKPAIEDAGFAPFRMDDTNKSTLIHADMFDHLINDPIALCDLSSKNPNVLYELGIRHAFDKPVVLVQEEGQTRIFDINGVGTRDYRRSRRYDEVLEDRTKITTALLETANEENKYSFMDLVNLAPTKVNKSKSISESDRMAFLLADMSRQLSRIESQIPRSQAITWETIDVSLKEEAAIALRNKRMSASNVLARIRRGEKRVDLPLLERLSRELTDAIVEAQRVNCNDVILIDRAKRTVEDLNNFITEQQNQFSPVG